MPWVTTFPRHGWVVCVVALALALGCTHDLDALQAGGSGGRPGTGGTGGSGGGSGSGSSGTGDSGSGGTSSGTGGSGGDAGPIPEACEPCDPLPMLAKSLGLNRCCRGPGGTECGVSFEVGELCLAPMTPGQEDDQCTDVDGPMSVSLPGCCRPDGACGVSAMALDLGCIGREDLPASFDASRSIPCRYECKADSDCDDLPDLLCVEHEADPDPADRFCAKSCGSDSDCDGDLVCAIANNDAEDRVDAYCQKPIGSLGPGGVCDSPSDCQTGLCARVGADGNTCAQLCNVPADCPESRPMCIPARILIPSKKTTPADQIASLPNSAFQQFGICAPSMD
jgi:hypothetical protein